MVFELGLGDLFAEDFMYLIFSDIFWFVYTLLVYLNFNVLHSFLWINFPALSYLVLNSFFCIVLGLINLSCIFSCILGNFIFKSTGTLAQRLECSPMARETWVQSQVESYQKTLKMVLDTTLLNTQHYKVRFKGKVEQSWEWSSALLYTLV